MTTDRWIALCYHDVQPAADTSGGGPQRFAVPLPMFERMLDTIRDEGFVGCSLASARAATGTRRVAITFDDANRGQYEFAMPALRARGMTATIYVVTDWVGRDGFMTWDELRQVRDWGMSVQSHTTSHPFLSELGEDALRVELERSKERLDRELGQHTVELAFPGGDAPRRALRGVMRASGYEVAVGSRWGANTDGDAPTRFVRRCTARGALTVDEARRYVHGDRWLALRHGPRETVLRTMRAAMGPTRYASLRRRFLDRRATGEPT